MEKSTKMFSGEFAAVTLGACTLIAVILLACVVFWQGLSNANPDGQEVPVVIAAGEK